jgi:FkbM family methyltransferase
MRLMLRSRVFLAAGQVASRLPHFRGRNRAVLSLIPALGLGGEHIFVDAQLHEPVAYRARLDMHSWLQRLAFVNGGYEAATVRLLSRLLDASPGYLLDVGANIGLISIPAALLTGRRVWALEAVPDNVTALRGNIAMNAIQDSITVVATAVGDVPGKFEIQVEGDLKTGEGTGTASIMAAGSTHPCVRIPIEVTTIDKLHAEGTLPDGCGVIKIDIDGYDLKALIGGRNFLGQSRPVVFGEFQAICQGWHGQTIEDVQKFAAGLGYELWPMAAKGQFTRDIDVHTFKQDALLVPSERVEQLRDLLA